MQTVISLVLAILLCELLSVSTLQNNMTTQARNFVEAQAGTNANVVNEWLVEDGKIVHTIRNGVAFMNTKDTDQIMDYLEVNLAKDIMRKSAAVWGRVLPVSASPFILSMAYQVTSTERRRNWRMRWPE
mgnify:CR=1 FL=1